MRFGDRGVPVGTSFRTRQEVFDAGVHLHTQAGIAGTRPAAASIVISGGYTDDLDLGDEIFYTGYGGRDPNSGGQVADQELKSWNMALVRNRDLCIPVRVIRGADPGNPFAPETGYRYDGLYDVVGFSPAEGRDGYRIFHYHLLRLASQAPAPWTRTVVATVGPPGRTSRIVSSINRESALAEAVKEIHGYRCQISGTSIDTLSGPYAEAAHIRPLGRPHDGPDALGNLLCLCPNDHVRLDRGVLVITEEFEVVSVASGEILSALAIDDDHWIDPAMIDYHRFIWTDLLSR
ncbi:MAG: HNH endonuclease [Actinobacteria bacterium]|nr:HNH endonuclease [Actinomycetota bacterium]